MSCPGSNGNTSDNSTQVMDECNGAETERSEPEDDRSENVVNEEEESNAEKEKDTERCNLKVN